MARSRKPAPAAVVQSPRLPVRRSCARDRCTRGCWGDAELCRIHLNEHLAGMRTVTVDIPPIATPTPSTNDPTTIDPAATGTSEETHHG